MTYNQRGQILVLTIIVVGLVLINTLFTISSSVLFSGNSLHSVQSAQALNLAEAAVDKALASLNATSGTYTGESETVLGDGVFDVMITTDSNVKTIQATGYIPNKVSPGSKKTVMVNAAKGNGVAFNYGLQVGEGGLEMGNNSQVTSNGSVYSNGNVTMENNATIQGDLIIAGGVQPTPDQFNDCSSPSCSDFLFAKNVAGDNQLDIAQSFTPATSNTLSRIEVKIKKIGTPPDLAVKILGDSDGKPNKNSIKATSSIPANTVATAYSFVPASFSNPPELDPGSKYWILLDTSTASSSNYWSWSTDTSQSYTAGSPMWSSDHQANNPVWNNILADLGFKTYLGGDVTSVTGDNGSQVNGNVRANTISGLTIGKDAYYQTISNSTVSGANCTNNSHCHPYSADPGPTIFALSNTLIDQWKNEASEQGVFTGDINNCQNLSSKKYVGNITFGNGCSSQATSPIWITGNLTLNNSNTITLASPFGTDSGVIIVDGTIVLGNGNKVVGTGSGNSELILITTFSSHTTNATEVNNSGNQVVLYAPDGVIDIGNNNTLQQVTGWKLKLGNGVNIAYNSGFSSLFISSGPGGAYSAVKGTYQIK